MGIRCGVGAVLVRVFAEIVLEPEATFQRFPPIFVLIVFLAIRLGVQDQVAAIPEIPGGELVVR